MQLVEVQEFVEPADSPFGDLAGVIDVEPIDGGVKASVGAPASRLIVGPGCDPSEEPRSGLYSSLLSETLALESSGRAGSLIIQLGAC